MNLCLFFEGTGNGVAGRFTNVTRLYNACAEDGSQMRHLESGPGTHFGAYLRGAIHGYDWWMAFRGAKRWFEANRRPEKASPEPTKVFLFGFSRGALIARRFAEWLGKLDEEVAFLGLWDTVDATLGLDVTEECPPNVRAARHAVSRDEARRLFAYVPLKPSAGNAAGRSIEEMAFPGSHSDVGGLFEDNHAIADASLEWIARGAERAGLKLKPGALEAITDPSGGDIVTHDSGGEISNLWGLLGTAKRTLGNVLFHPLCKSAKP